MNMRTTTDIFCTPSMSVILAINPVFTEEDYKSELLCKAGMATCSRSGMLGFVYETVKYLSNLNGLPASSAFLTIYEGGL